MTGAGGLPEQPCIGHTATADQIRVTARMQSESHSEVSHFVVFGSGTGRMPREDTAEGGSAEGIAVVEPGSCGSG